MRNLLILAQTHLALFLLARLLTLIRVLKPKMPESHRQAFTIGSLGQVVNVIGFTPKVLARSRPASSQNLSPSASILLMLAGLAHDHYPSRFFQKEHIKCKGTCSAALVCKPFCLPEPAEPMASHKVAVLAVCRVAGWRRG